MMISRLTVLCLAMTCLYSHISAAAVQAEGMTGAAPQESKHERAGQGNGQDNGRGASIHVAGTAVKAADEHETAGQEPPAATGTQQAGAASSGVQPGSGANRLTAEQWERGRSGDTILTLPAVRSVVDEWLADTERLIEIRYPGGEEGEFWVHELADWLVALGIPADKLLMTPGSTAGDVISFHLVRSY